MALGVSSKLSWSYIFNAPFVNIAGRNLAGRDQVAQPLRGIGVEFVVVRGHSPTLSRAALNPRRTAWLASSAITAIPSNRSFVRGSRFTSAFAARRGLEPST
jgi:hypothetical protein